MQNEPNRPLLNLHARASADVIVMALQVLLRDLFARGPKDFSHGCYPRSPYASQISSDSTGMRSSCESAQAARSMSRAFFCSSLRTRKLGAAMALALMTTPIFFHVSSPLGIDPYGDSGVLFKQACDVWLSSVIFVLIRRREGIALVAQYLPFVPLPARLRTP